MTQEEFDKLTRDDLEKLKFVLDSNWKVCIRWFWVKWDNWKTILNWSVDPTTEWVDGDFYINTTTWQIFWPKATVWGIWTNLKWQVQTVVWWSNISIDNTDPNNPVINFTLWSDENFVTDVEKTAIWTIWWKEDVANKWQANWYAPLWADSKISSTYLPSYVDDVIEVNTYWDLPVTWETWKIYIVLTWVEANREYRWSWSVYVEIKDSWESTASLWSLINSATEKTTPVDADMVWLMDSAGSNVLKKLSWANIKATLKTYFDWLYDNPNFFKYQIVTSVNSWNLTVALKNYLWQNPSVAVPVKVQIGDTVRTITSALGDYTWAWINVYNAWSSELATKEIDFFVYLWYRTSDWTVRMWISRISYATKVWDFHWAVNNEKFCSLKYLWFLSDTDKATNIWRFNAILSDSWSGYQWSIPATSVIINYPIFETRELLYTPQITCSWSMTFTWASYKNTYLISWKQCIVNIWIDWTTSWTQSAHIITSLPFSPFDTSNSLRWVIRWSNNANIISTTYYLTDKIYWEATTWTWLTNWTLWDNSWYYWTIWYII